MSLILRWTLYRQQTEGTDGLRQQRSDYNHDHHWGHPQVVLCVWMLRGVLLFETVWAVACLAPLSMGFPRQKYWSGLPFPPPRNLPNSGIVPASPASPALQEDSLPPESFGEAQKTNGTRYACGLSCKYEPGPTLLSFQDQMRLRAFRVALIWEHLCRYKRRRKVCIYILILSGHKDS